MELTIRDRVILLDCLPPQASLADYRIMHDLKMKLSMTQEEVAVSGFASAVNPENNSVNYSWREDITKEFQLDGRTLEIVKEAVKRLDKEGRVSDQNIHLFDLFGVE